MRAPGGPPAGLCGQGWPRAPPPFPSPAPFKEQKRASETIVSQTPVISSKRLLFINKDVKITPARKGCRGGGPARGLPGAGGPGVFVRQPPPFSNTSEGSL